MKTIIYRFLLSVLILMLVLLQANPVFAHGDDPRLEISVEQINPGGVIEVRGVDFEMDGAVTLELIGADITLPQGELTADTEGVFSQIVTLPADLQEGTYLFRATTDDHVIESPAFTVWGMAISEEENGQRTDEDPLLAPMPTYAPGVSVTPMPVIESVKESTSSETSSLPWVFMIVGAAGLLILFAVTFFVRKRT